MYDTNYNKMIKKVLDLSTSLGKVEYQGNLKVSTTACKFSPEQEFVAIEHFSRFGNFL